MEPAEFSTSYLARRGRLEKLRDYAVGRLSAELGSLHVVVVDPRIKDPDTAYQKLQTGEYPNALALDDLVGVKIVVLRRSEIEIAAAIVRSSFQVVREKARIIDPVAFRYREPHIIVVPPADYLERNPDLDGLKVEVQLTTGVQHALDMATHSFDYKGSTLEWAKYRLVAQLRANLEIVDNILDNMESSAQLIEKSVAFPDDLLEQIKVLEVVSEAFADENLPSDRRRLAETIAIWTTAAGLDADGLRDLLERNADLVSAVSLAPLDAILGALMREHLEALLSTDRRFAISTELASLCPEANQVPDDRRVSLS
jgi:ppGpp synthetase/RelA/SpoT-type nucleotidyltranferase